MSAALGMAPIQGFAPDISVKVSTVTSKISTPSPSHLLIDTSQSPGLGIVNQTMQFHGTTDEYLLAGTRAVATLYSDAAHSTAFPAVTLNNRTNGAGSAAAFSYDLARSVVYSQQGNPGWSSQERRRECAGAVRRSLFRAKARDFQPDWVDMAKVAIAQADEQQRLLANLVLFMNGAQKTVAAVLVLPARPEGCRRDDWRRSFQQWHAATLRHI